MTHFSPAAIFDRAAHAITTNNHGDMRLVAWDLFKLAETNPLNYTDPLFITLGNLAKSDIYSALEMACKVVRESPQYYTNPLRDQMVEFALNHVDTLADKDFNAALEVVVDVAKTSGLDSSLKSKAVGIWRRYMTKLATQDLAAAMKEAGRVAFTTMSEKGVSSLRKQAISFILAHVDAVEDPRKAIETMTIAAYTAPRGSLLNNQAISMILENVDELAKKDLPAALRAMRAAVEYSPANSELRTAVCEKWRSLDLISPVIGSSERGIRTAEEFIRRFGPRNG